MKSLCVAVPRREGENIRKKLSDAGLLRTDLRPRLEGETLYIPVCQVPDGLNYPILDNDFLEVERQKGYREYLDLPPGLMEMLPASFDVVGDIYLIKLDEPLLPHAAEIASALLRANRNARVVALDRGVQGEFRTRDLRILAGESRTVTLHREYGLEYHLDLSTVYFSPRLATERRRIADLAEPGERVVDMFCGVGPFSLMLASTGRPSVVYAVDKNPEAINYLILNIKHNKIKKVSPMLGDARVMVPQLARPDRIIMNLPHSSLDFLDLALDRVSQGGWIHLYVISEPDTLALVEGRVNDMAQAAGRGASMGNIRQVHNYSPAQKLYCLDIRVD